MYLIFDTETTGLPLNYKAPITDTENWTRLVQLAWIEYDINGEELRRSNLIIKPEGFIIPQDSIEIHRITNEIANEKGIALADAVEQFDNALLRNHYLIAHNISFDQKIMGSEYVRLSKDYRNLYAIEHIDTKDTTVQFCKIPSRGKGFNFKWPTLTELHETLFGRGFDDAHDALADVLALAKCFFKLQEIQHYDYKDIPQKIIGLGFVPKEGSTYDYDGDLSDAELDKPVVSLGVHTDHSLLRGAATAQHYIDVAKKNNHPAIGITDWNTMSGTLEFWMKCKEAKIHPVLGMELMVNENVGKFEEQGDEGGDFPLKFFIKNQEGYVNINKLLYRANTEGFRYPYGRIKTEWLLQNKKGIIVTAGCHSGFICDLMQKGHKREAEAYFKLLHDQFGEDFYVEIKLNELIVQKRLNNFLLNLASKYGVKVFTDNDVHYVYPEDNDLQDTLLAIGQKAPRSQARLFERRSLYYPTRRDYLKMNRKFGYNYPEDVLMSFMDNTLELGRKCRFDFDTGSEKYPRYEATPEIIEFFGTDDPEKIIYKLSFGKLNKKLKERAIRTNTPISKEQVQEYHDRLNFELEVIKSKSMLDYFLVNWELIRYYRSTGHEIGAARGCFLPNSLVVMGDNMKAPIETISIGDFVVDAYGDNKEVLEVFEYDVNEEVVLLEFEDGRIIECTKDHEILTSNRGWVKADELTEEDDVIDVVVKNTQKTISKSYRDYSGKVYDLKIEGSETYNIEGLAVHNSGGGSLLSYALDITKIDPLKYGLYFERFLNPTRNCMTNKCNVLLKDGSYKNITQLTLEDDVETETGEGKLVQIHERDLEAHEEVFEIETEDGIKIQLTGCHIVPVEREGERIEVRVDEILESDELFSI
tara:strand:- start:16740 stop:19349 length:2610 start_codon:yes stop_codon:yes gene_type:complete